MTGIVTSRRDGRDMPNFENLKRALLCQGEPDYVPLFEGTIAEDIKSQYLGRPVRGLEDEVDFCMRAGYDFVPLTIGLRQTLRGELTGIMGTKEVETSVLKAAEGNYNPFTEESNTRMWAEHGQGVICDEDSIEAFPWPKADSFSYDTVERLGKLLPDGAMAIINVGYIFTAPWMLMGLEPFCISLATGDGVAQKVIERVGKIQKQVVENLVQFDCVGAIRMPDDLGYTTGVMISPRLLREYIFPWDKQIGDVVKQAGLMYLYHSDGRLYDVMDDLVDCGFCAIHPCEPASMDIAELKRKYHGRLCVCGNIDLDSTLTLGTPADVEEEVKMRIRTLAPGGGYCCGASNSVPEYVPFDNYIAMIETVKKYGKYPICV
jgi:uroporphyrinogen decarboxylase